MRSKIQIMNKYSNDKESFHVYCAWCGKQIKEGDPSLRGHSHGICQDCYGEVMENINKLKKEDYASTYNWYKIAKDVGHEYSWVYVNLPKDIQQKLLEFGKQIDPDDLYEKEAEGGLEKEPHITLKYGLLTDFPKDIRQRLEEEKGGKAYMGKSSIFEKEKYDVVKIEVESEDLDRLHARLNELPHEDKYPDYNPHATIAYVKKGKGKKYKGYFKLDQSFKFDKVYFGNRKDRDYCVKLSFSIR